MLEIAAIRCIVPGYGEAGKPFGELVSTTKILQNLQTNNNIEEERFNVNYVKDRLGVQSVAFTNSSLEYLSHFQIKDNIYRKTNAFKLAQSHPNYSLYQMLDTAVYDVVNANISFQGGKKIKAHIHIHSWPSPWIEYELVKIRKKNELEGEKPLVSVLMQQGCAGLFNALDMASSLLDSNNSVEGNHVLITAENNLQTSIHQHMITQPKTSDLNEWLWPTIFGEGVGAMLVTKSSEQDTNKWQISGLHYKLAANDWRVSCQPRQGYHNVTIRAKEVGETYFNSMVEHSSKLIAEANGINNLDRLCFHESNPMLLGLVGRHLNVPQEKIPTISAQVGTLACVSSYSLMEKVFKELEPTSPSPAKVGMCLIGEACGRIVAGRMILNRNQKRDFHTNALQQYTDLKHTQKQFDAASMKPNSRTQFRLVKNKMSTANTQPIPRPSTRTAFTNHSMFKCNIHTVARAILGEAKHVLKLAR